MCLYPIIIIIIIIGDSYIITSVHHIECINTDTHKSGMSVYKYS